MNGKRCYKQYCGLAKALDVIGERWTILILRDLMLGPWRYSDLLERMNGITTNLLANRLKDMESNGLIKKSRLSSLGSPHVYELTELGLKLEPAMIAISHFGSHFMHSGPTPDEALDAGRALLNLKSCYQGRSKGSINFIIENKYNQNQQKFYHVTYSTHNVDIRHGEMSQSPVCVELSLETYSIIAFRNGDTTKLEKKGEIRITGDTKSWTRFLDAFGFVYS